LKFHNSGWRDSYFKSRSWEKKMVHESWGEENDRKKGKKWCCACKKEMRKKIKN